MKGMKSAAEFQQAPPPGTYWGVIAVAEATFSKSGSSMLKLTPTIDDTRFPQYKDQSCDDYIITDGGAKGGGMGKTKLRGFGIDVDSSDAELPDEAICAQLQGKALWITFGNEARMTRTGEEGPYNIPMTAVDPVSGQTIKLMKLIVKSYSLHNVGQAQVAPVQHAAPVQHQQAPQQGFAPAPGFAAPQQTQFAPAPVQHAPQFAPQQVQQHAAPVQPQYAGQPPLQPAFQQPQAQQPVQLQQAAPPWAGQAQPGQPNGAPPAAPKGKRKLNVPNEDSGQPA